MSFAHNNKSFYTNYPSDRIMSLLIGILAFIGALLTLYLLHVEASLLQNKNYKSLCDISDKVTCTGVAKSQYAHLFGVSNAVLGILYYGLVAILAIFGEMRLITIVSIPAMVLTLVLGYMLFYKIKKVCPVCYAAYIINGLIFILSLMY